MTNTELIDRLNMLSAVINSFYEPCAVYKEYVELSREVVKRFETITNDIQHMIDTYSNDSVHE